MRAVALALIVIVSPLLACAVYQAVFMLLSSVAILSERRRDRLPPQSRLTVIVPAHNEALLIRRTVRSLLDADYPEALRTVIVIADNCTDDTAALARSEGALAYERNDPSRPGKPYALDWLLRQLDPSSFDGVCIIDADTLLDRDFLREMDAQLRAGQHAIQGYFGVMNPDENWLTRIGVLPSVLKFRLHYPGKRLVGLSCPLAGNGMCFSGDVIRRFGWNAFSLTENWEYYVILTLAGYLTTVAPSARIYSQLAKSLKQGETQRMRWMKGRLDTARRYWPQLLSRGIREVSLVKLDVIVELLRPSHSMLLFSSVATFAVAAIGYAVDASAMSTAMALSTATVALQLVYFFAGLAIQRPPLRTWLSLAMVPLYLVWKVVVTAKGLVGFRDQRWIKTTRHDSR